MDPKKLYLLHRLNLQPVATSPHILSVYFTLVHINLNINLQQESETKLPEMFSPRAKFCVNIHIKTYIFIFRFWHDRRSAHSVQFIRLS